jgi:hypothetical protein
MFPPQNGLVVFDHKYPGEASAHLFTPASEYQPQVTFSCAVHSSQLVYEVQAGHEAVRVQVPKPAGEGGRELFTQHLPPKAPMLFEYQAQLPPDCWLA